MTLQNITEQQLTELQQLWATLFPDTLVSPTQWAYWATLHTPAAMKEAFIALAKKRFNAEVKGESFPPAGMLAYASAVMNRVTRTATVTEAGVQCPDAN